MKKSVIIILALAIFLFALSGCGKKEADVVKIGVINSVTGPAGSLGKNIQNGIDLAVDEINTSGGIGGKMIKIYFEDDATNTKNSVSAFNKLVDVEKVKVIIGPASSGGVMACAPLANEKNIVLLSSGAGSPNISKAGPYIFRNRVAGNLEAQQLAIFCLKKLGLSKMTILRINTDYGVGFAEIFRSVFESNGGKIEDIESFNQGDTDFRNQITKFKTNDIENVYLVGVPRECGLILKQSRELKIECQYFANNIESDELLEIAGPSAEGLIYIISAYNPENSEKTIYFNAMYIKKYGKRTDMFAADGYDAVYLLKTAIESSGYKKEQIRKGLLNISNFPGVNGTINFDENGDVVKELSIRQVKNGEFIPFINE